MKVRFDDREFVTQHVGPDPIEGRLPSFLQVVITLAVLALAGIHWVPVTAWLDGADPATVVKAILEMWGLAALIVVGGCVLVAVLTGLAGLVGRVLASVADVAGWPGAEDED
jgi:uncharacterized membrane protein YidH (DUF202 family)